MFFFTERRGRANDSRIARVVAFLCRLSCKERKRDVERLDEGTPSYYPVEDAHLAKVIKVGDNSKSHGRVRTVPLIQTESKRSHCKKWEISKITVERQKARSQDIGKTGNDLQNLRGHSPHPQIVPEEHQHRGLL